MSPRSTSCGAPPVPRVRRPAGRPVCLTDRLPVRLPIGLAARLLVGLLACLPVSLPVAIATVPGADRSRNPDEAYFVLPRDSMRVGSVEITRRNIFPADDPYAETFYGRLANRLHVVTREHVIERGLRIAPGDTITAEDLGAALRRLRSYYFIHDDVAFDLDFARDTLHLDVTTRDVWTTRPEFQFRKTGDLLTWSVSLEESNLLGWGKGMGGFVGESEIRSIYGAWYHDRQLFGTRAYLRLVLSRGEDTRDHSLLMGRPFDRARTPWGFEVTAFDYDGPFVDHRGGLDGPEWHLDRSLLSAAWGPRVAATNRTALRIKPAVYFLRERYAAPDLAEAACTDRPPGECLGPPMRDRDIRAFGLEFDYIHERYSEWRNINSIGRDEDFNLGTELIVRMGYSPRRWSERENAWFFLVEGSQGKPLGEDTFALAVFEGLGQLIDGAWRDAWWISSTGLYHNLTSRHTVATRLRVDLSRGLYPQHILTMGADSGLRGFEAHRFHGEQVLLWNLEDRWIVREDLLGLVSIGAVGFVDGGLIWSEGAHRAVKPRLGAGVGLRLLGSRTRGLFVTRVDLGYPVVGKEDKDGWVLTIAAGQGF